MIENIVLKIKYIVRYIEVKFLLWVTVYIYRKTPADFKRVLLKEGWQYEKMEFKCPNNDVKTVETFNNNGTKFIITTLTHKTYNTPR